MPGHPALSLAFLLASLAAGRSTPEREVRESAARVREAPPERSGFLRLAERPVAGTAGPLAGVALGFGDLFDTFDLETAYGAALHPGYRPPGDAALAARARMLGATIIGKTATVPFGLAGALPARHPLDPARTAGTGAALAVAGGFVAAAIGSQTAGETIGPASFCGIAGFKPSFRLAPVSGLKPLAWSLDTAGLFAGGVRDVALLAEHLSNRPMRIGIAERAPIRIGLYRSAIDETLHPEMAAARDHAARALERDGCILVDIRETAVLSGAREAHETVRLFEAAQSLLHEFNHHAARLDPALLAKLGEGMAIPPAAYDEARRAARAGRRETTRLFETCDVLLAPSACGPAPRLEDGTGDPAFNRLWTLAGVPCVNVPGLHASNGLALGVCVVARFGRDAAALALAARLEGLFVNGGG